MRDYEFKDFVAAMAFVNRVADVAEEVNHHPDILVHEWNNVRLTLTTHSEGKLTDNDHAMAQRIDGLGGGAGVPFALSPMMNDDDSSRSRPSSRGGRRRTLAAVRGAR